MSSKVFPFSNLWAVSVLSVVVAACATHGSRGPASPSEMNKGPHFANLRSVDTNSLGESDDEESDVADAEKVEGAPEDLGEIAYSSKRREDEVRADAEAGKTFPLVYNEFVDQWVRYFTGRGRGTFERWLGRSTRYIPTMKEVLRKEGLPEDLIYLAMIESGFNPKASSRAKAVGPWQFIKGTGVRYDLEVGYWLDERRDFIKASVAAAKYLRELHQVFGSWYLAAASYNAGEGKVLNAIRKDRSRNFWELCRAKKNFRAETRNYVPKIIAAALIAKDPGKYGFNNISYENPFTWATVTVPAGVDLRSVAELINVDKEDLLILNAELRRGITPPQDEGFAIKVPPQSKELLIAKVGELKSQKLNKYFVTHRVRRGDTLSSIARRYGSNVQTILELNDMKKVKRLKVGSELSIPISDRVASKKGTERPFPSPAPAPFKDQSRNKIIKAESRLPASASPKRGGKYIVQEGDTLWNLSQKLGVTVNEIKRANNMRSSALKPGHTLTIPN